MASKKQKAAKGGAPISTHPAFPAIVALWFSALFGIGSLVLPTSLLESMITAIGLDKILPAAAPPLGFTARGIIALLVAGTGLAAGLVLARKVANSQSPSKERSRDLQLKDADRHPDAPAKRPISARRELGSEGLGPVDDPWKFEDEWAGADDDDDGYDYDSFDDDDRYAAPAKAPAQGAANIPGRRRALSVTDDSGPSDYLLTVPLPGQSHDDALELDILEEEEPGMDEIAQEEFTQETAALRNDTQVEPEPISAAPDAEAAFSAETQVSAHPGTMFAQPVASDTENHFATSLVQEEPMIQPTPPSEPSFAAPPHPAAALASDPANAPGPNALSDLGMSELVERFATAMQAKAERDEEAAVPKSAVKSAFDGANPFADRAGDAEINPLTGKSGLPFKSPLSSTPFASPATATLDTSEETQGEDPNAVPAPMVFRRAAAAAVEETPFPTPEAPAMASLLGQERAMPSVLQPLSVFDEDEDEYDDTAHAPLSIDFARQRPFADPVAREASPAPAAADPETPAAAPFAMPAQFAQPPEKGPEQFPEQFAEQGVDLADDEEDSQDAYSSLLNMKSKLSGHDFVRIEEDGEADDALPEPVVVFPGHQAGGQDGAARMFDAPSAACSSANPVPNPTTPPSPPSDPTETERALREALEKLQRMSGAA